MPFEPSLAVRVRERHPDGVTCECPINESFLNSHGVLHGGVIATIADEAAWYAIDAHTPFGPRSVTTELKVNYLEPIVGSKVVARTVLLRVGKTLCVTRVDISGDKGTLAAVAIVTYMILPDA